MNSRLPEMPGGQAGSIVLFLAKESGCKIERGVYPDVEKSILDILYPKP